MTRRHPMTLQLQQQWRKDGAPEADHEAATHQTNEQPVTQKADDEQPTNS